MGIMKKLLIGTLWLTALHLGCGMESVDPGTETTNGEGIIISVVNNKLHGKSSDPAATVILCDSRLSTDFKGLFDTLYPDAKGEFLLENIPEGSYNIFAYPSTAGLGAAIQSILIKTGLTFSDSALYDSLNCFSGLVLHDSMIRINAIAYIAGSPFQTRSDTNGTFVFDKIPNGRFTITVQIDSSEVNWEIKKTIPIDSCEVNFDLKYAIGVTPPGPFSYTFELKP